MATAMPKTLTEFEAQTLLRSITIPPRPEILLTIQAEQRKEDPDIQRIRSLIEQDVSLTAAVLKTANSPLYGNGGWVASIQHALNFLGLNNLANVVLGFSLRMAITDSQQTDRFEHFWESASRHALLMRFFSQQTGMISPDEAYVYGLFQECGTPVMHQRFKDYEQTLQLIASEPHRHIEIEEQRHSTSHAVVGYLMARTWFLPTHVAEAILNHHEDLNGFCSDRNVNLASRSLLVLSALAEHIYQDGTTESRDWNTLRPQLVQFMGLSESELDTLVDAGIHALNQ